ncbi:MAG: hypothetical protein Q8P12_05110, partial [bacterium]|nr:hypothetical protein [bacterium]
ELLLDQEIPDRFTENERLLLKGRVTNASEQVTAFYTDAQNNQRHTVRAKTDANGNFSLFLSPPPAGDYRLGMIPGTNGSSVVHPVTVHPSSCLSETENTSLPVPIAPSLKLKNGDTVIDWAADDANLFQLTFSQGTRVKQFLLHTTSQWVPEYSAFSSFREGEVTLTFRRSRLEAKSLAEVGSVVWSPPVTATFEAVVHHEYVLRQEAVSPVRIPDHATLGEPLLVEVKPSISLRSEGALILPDGEVKKIELSSSEPPVKNQHDLLVYPPSSDPVTLSFTPLQSGIHFVEINDAEGLAAVNIPLYPKNSFPLLPNLLEGSPRTVQDLGTDLQALRGDFLRLVNQDRRDHQRTPLTLDQPLSRLAQFRADDMTKNGYFGHWDSAGRAINDHRKAFAITQTVSENIAKDVSVAFAQ